jgi:hypothetical protein
LPGADRLLDARIGAAAAEIAGHRMPDLLRRRLRVRGHERGRRDDLAWGAEAALERVGADERADERMVAEALDRRHLSVAHGVDERDAAERRRAVELDGARAAMALAAGDLRPRQAELVAQRLGQRLADRCLELVVVAVDAQPRRERSPP